MIITTNHKSYIIKNEIELMTVLFFIAHQNNQSWDVLLKDYEI